MSQQLLLISDGGPFKRADGKQHLPFGAEHLTTHRFRIENPHRTHRPGLLKKARDVIEHRSGVLIEDGLRGIGSRADVVVAMFENNAALPLILRRMAIPPYKNALLVVIVCWATEELLHMDWAERNTRIRELNRADLILVLSANQVEILTSMGLEAKRIRSILFGVETEDFAVKASPNRHRLVAVGQDRGRDYGTLAEAVGGTGIEIDLYCKPGNIEGLDLPSEIINRGVVSKPEYRRILQEARAIIVPTHELAYPTGQTVALEGSAAGALVIGTATPAFSEYFTHDVTALLSTPYDAAGLRENIQRATADPDAYDIAVRGQEVTLERFTSSRMWDAIAKALTAALEERQ